MYNYKAELIRIVNADTIDLLVDLGFSVHHVVRVQLLGVDAPETHGVKHSSEEFARGTAAAEFVEAWFKNATALRLNTTKTGKYGRWLGVISKIPALKSSSEVAVGFSTVSLNAALEMWLKEQKKGD